VNKCSEHTLTYRATRSRDSLTLHVLADGRDVDLDWDVQLLQQCAVADAAELEDLRRLEAAADEERVSRFG
jgi:hypothetical protein